MCNVFSANYHVGAGETDPFGVLRASSLMYFLQDAATLHSEKLAFSREELLQSRGVIWVLVKIAFYLRAPILSRQDVSVDTWHRGPEGVCFYRDFDIFAQGEKVGYAVSAWVLAEMATLRPLRPSALSGESLPVSRERAHTEVLGRLTPPDVTEFACSREIRYSDLDINNHLNNVRYADLVCDALGMAGLPPSYVSSMRINYSAQCTAGETVFLHKGRVDGGGYYVAGLDGAGKKRFDAAASLEPL